MNIDTRGHLREVAFPGEGENAVTIMRRQAHSLFVLTALAFLGVATAAGATDTGAGTETVRTTHGPVVGARLTDVDVIAFKGIRYGQPPTGELRWKPPVPAAAWTDPRPAGDFGP